MKGRLPEFSKPFIGEPEPFECLVIKPAVSGAVRLWTSFLGFCQPLFICFNACRWRRLAINQSNDFLEDLLLLWYGSICGALPLCPLRNVSMECFQLFWRPHPRKAVYLARTGRCVQWVGGVHDHRVVVSP